MANAAPGDAIGAASIKLTLDTSDLKKQLSEVGQQIRGVKDIRLSVDVSSQRRITESVAGITRQLDNLKKVPINFDTQSIGRLGKEFSDARAEIVKFTKGILDGEKSLASTTVGILQQARAFGTLAANVGIGSTAYTKFVQAQEKATQKVGLKGGLADVSALQQLYAAPPTRPITDVFKGTRDLLTFERSVPKVNAAIQIYKAELERALSVTDQGSVKFRLLNAAIERQQRLLGGEGAPKPTSGFGAASASNFGLNPDASAIAGSIRRNQEAIARGIAQEGKLREDAARISSKQLNVDLERQKVINAIARRIEETSAAAQSGGFGAASAANFGTTDPVEKSIRRNTEKRADEEARVNRELEKEARAREDALRVSQRQLATDQERQKVINAINRRIEDTSKAAQAGGFGAASAAGFGTTDPTEKSIQRNARKREAQAQRLQSQSDILESDLARQRENRQRTAAAINARIERARQVESEAEKRRQARQERISGAASSALIGGGFPLLFGQGAGASLGGGLGGLAGGALGGGFGFGISIAGTALGTAVDTLVTRTKDLAAALQDPIAAFDQLKQAGQFSSKGIETLIETLTKSGRTALAARVARTDLAGALDPGTAVALATTTDDLNRSASQLQNQLGQFLAGPAIGFNQWLSDVIKRTQQAPQNPLLKFIGDVYQTVIPLGIATRSLGKEGAATQQRVNQAIAPFASPLAQNDTRSIRIQEQIIRAKTQISSLDTKITRDTAALLQYEERLAQSDRRVTEAKRAQAALIAANTDGNGKVNPEAQRQADKSAADAIQAEQSAQRDIKAERLAAEREIEIERKRVAVEAGVAERSIVDARLNAETEIAQRRRESNTTVRQLNRERDVIVGGQGLSAVGQGALRAAAQYRDELDKAADAVTRVRENTAQANREAATAVTSAQARLSANPNDPSTQQALAAAIANRTNLEKKGATEVDIIRRESDARSLSAATVFSNNLITGAKAAKAEVLQIARSLEDSKLQLIQLQGTPNEGLNQYRSPQEQYNATSRALENIQGAVRKAIRETGITPQFYGSIESQLAQSIDFVRAARTEQRLTQDIGTQEDQLKQANASLVIINGELVKNVGKLNTSVVDLAKVIYNWRPAVPTPTPTPTPTPYLP